MNSNAVRDVFEWHEISITQSNEVFKIGTDAILLGSWISHLIRVPGSILDIGTGTGVLALKMSSIYPLANIEAIDQDENAVRLAEDNFRLSKAKERLSVRLENVFDASICSKKTYDLVLCNPPYYFSNSNEHHKALVASKHTLQHTSKWVLALSARIKEGGHICIVLPFEYTFDWITSANESRLYVQDRLDIYSFENDHEPKRSLLHFRNLLVKPKLDRLTLYSSNKSPSKEYLEFSGLKTRI